MLAFAVLFNALLNITTALPKVCSVITDEKNVLKVVDGDHKPMVAQATFVDDKFNTTGFVIVCFLTKLRNNHSSLLIFLTLS